MEDWAKVLQNFGLAGLIIFAFGIFAWKWLLPFLKDIVEKERQGREKDVERERTAREKESEMARKDRERDLTLFTQALKDQKDGLHAIARELKELKGRKL